MSEEQTQKILNDANTALSSGDIDAAIGLFEQVIQMDPNHAEGHSKLAELYTQKGLKEKAAREYMLLGNAYYESRLFKNALKYFQKVLELDPSAINARVKAAEIYVTQEMEREAKLEFLAISEHYLSENNLHEAEAFCKKAIDLKSIEAHYIMGLICFKRGMWKEAGIEFEMLVKIKVNHAGAWAHLAICYSNLNKTNEAQAALDRVMKIDANDIDAQRASGLINAKKGAVPEAIGFYVKAIDDALTGSNIEKALEISNEAASVISNSPDIMFKRGEALESARQGKDAAFAFNSAAGLYLKAGAADASKISADRAKAVEFLVPAAPVAPEVKEPPKEEPKPEEKKTDGITVMKGPSIAVARAAAPKPEPPKVVEPPKVAEPPKVVEPPRQEPPKAEPPKSEPIKQEPVAAPKPPSINIIPLKPDIQRVEMPPQAPAAAAKPPAPEPLIIEKTNAAQPPAAAAVPPVKVELPKRDAVLDSFKNDLSASATQPKTEMTPPPAARPAEPVHEAPKPAAGTVEDLFAQAEKHMRDAFFEKSIEIYRTILKKEPRNTAVRAKLHQAYLLLAQQEEDISKVQGTSKTAPGTAPAPKPATTASPAPSGEIVQKKKSKISYL